MYFKLPPKSRSNPIFAAFVLVSGREHWPPLIELGVSKPEQILRMPEPRVIIPEHSLRRT